MALHTQYLYDERIFIGTADETTTPDDVKAHQQDYLTPYINEQAPNIVHTIFDVRRISWDFMAFIQLSKNTNQGRKSGEKPQNIQQYFVGNDAWVNNWRTMIQKQHGEATYAFESVDLALEYIREQTS